MGSMLHPPQQADLTDEHARQRVRFTYEKGEAIKFISHQDESRLWERTLRRANLPLLYKRGFNPQPHIQFAAPLGLGMTGVRELLDVAFSPPVPLDELSMRIREKLPPGVRLLDATEVPFKTVSPQSLNRVFWSQPAAATLCGLSIVSSVSSSMGEAMTVEPPAPAVTAPVARSTVRGVWANAVLGSRSLVMLSSSAL